MQIIVENEISNLRGSTMIEADYMVVGAGAMGMAFADVLVAETDAILAIVDRYGRPGGHWTRAYPFVRLHQPSAYYGVNSRELGSGAKDTRGWNTGLYELASGAEILAYYDQVMRRDLLPSGQVQYLPMCEHRGEVGVRSLISGETFEVKAEKIVDGTYSKVAIPSVDSPSYEVADGAWCAPPNDLTALERPPGSYVVIGAGKTGMDACLYLLGNGVEPNEIRWIRPRDPWMLDRAKIQPGPEFGDRTLNYFARKREVAVQARSIDDLFERLEAEGLLLRFDPAVRPTMYRGATVTTEELRQMRRIEKVVRLGYVQTIGRDEITLDDGTIPTTPETLHIDCTAYGLERTPAVPVFDGEHITLQNLRTLQPTFSAALIGHLEASYESDAEKNELSIPNPYPSSDIDWLRIELTNLKNSARWAADEKLTAWIRGSRLDIISHTGVADPTPAQRELVGKIRELTPGAISNLERLLGNVA